MHGVSWTIIFCLVASSVVQGFQFSVTKTVRIGMQKVVSRKQAVQAMSMVLDSQHTIETSMQLLQSHSHWINTVYHGLAEATDTIPAAVAEAPKVCPNFGEAGWAPFCFLNGNPVFKAFDGFQLFIQNSVVSLHDFLQARGVQQAYGPSIIMFTIFIRLILFPLNYQQIASTQMVQALNPKVQEIREKYADNRELQAQMTALLYQEAKVQIIISFVVAIMWYKSQCNLLYIYYVLIFYRQIPLRVVCPL